MANQPLVPAGEQDLRRKLKYTCYALVFLLLSGVLFTVSRAGSGGRSAALLWGFASLVTGAIVGFLFAVPRVPSKDKSLASSETAKAGTSLAVATSTSEERGFGLGINTNLEDISDWFTKMLVGIGLVELRAIPGYIVRLGHFVGQSIGLGMESTAASLVIYFSGLGFLSSYLLTRMFIGPAFLLADLATNSGVAYDAAHTAGVAYKEANRAVAIANVNADIADALQVLSSKEAHPPARSEQLIRVLESYSGRFPLNRRLHIVLARLHKDRGDFGPALHVLSHFIERKRAAGQFDLDLSDALFNVACYNSMQMKDLDSQSSRASLADQAAGAVRESVRITPNNLKDFYTDPDLEEFRDSETGRSLVNELGPVPED